MKIYTRKSHIIEILGAFTSGCLEIPTREGIMKVDIADLAQAARRSLDVRELYDDFLPRDAIIDEASVARGLTMFAYVYASLATASSPADPKLGFSTILLDNIDLLDLPRHSTRRLARSGLLFVGDVLSFDGEDPAVGITRAEATLVRETAERHSGGAPATLWPPADLIGAPQPDLHRRARIDELPIDRTALGTGLARRIMRIGLRTVGDVARVPYANVMSYAGIWVTRRSGGALV